MSDLLAREGGPPPAARPERHTTAESPESPLPSSAVVGFVEGAALFLVVEALVLLAAGHTENVEQALYLIAFVCVLPAAVVSTIRWGKRLPARELAALAWADGVALASALAVARFTSRPTIVLLAAAAIILASNRLLAGPGRPTLAAAADRTPPLAPALPLFLFAAVLPFLPSTAYGARRLGLTLLLAPCRPVQPPGSSGWRCRDAVHMTGF